MIFVWRGLLLAVNVVATELIAHSGEQLSSEGDLPVLGSEPDVERGLDSRQGNTEFLGGLERLAGFTGFGYDAADVVHVRIFMQGLAGQVVEPAGHDAALLPDVAGFS